MAQLQTNVTLNGETVEVTVYEDTTNNGSANNQETVNVGNGTNTYSLSNIESIGSNTTWTRIDLSTANTSNSPEVHSVELLETVPESPSSLSASGTGDDINLSWSDDSTNEDGFRIYRALSSGSTTGDYTQIDTVGTNTTSYADNNLSDGERYYYRVTAYNTAGESAVSNQSAHTTDLPSPSGLSLNTGTEGEVGLSWTDNSDNEDGFEIFRSTDGSSFSSVTTVGSNTTTYTDTGLTDGDEYWYYVESYTEHRSSASPTVSDVTFLPQTNIDSITNVDQTTLDINWTKQDNNGAGEWRIYRSTDGSLGTEITGGLTSSTSSYNDSGLNEDTAYYYTLRRDTTDATKDSTQDTVTTAANKTRSVTSYSTPITANIIRLGEGVRVPNSHTAIVTSNATRVGTGSRVLDSYTNTVFASTTEVQTVFKTESAYASPIQSQADRVVSAYKTPNTHTSFIFSTVNRTGEGLRSSNSYTNVIFGSSLRSALFHPTINSHTEIFVSTSDRVGTGVRTPTGYIPSIVSSSDTVVATTRSVNSYSDIVFTSVDRDGTGSRTTNSYTSPIFTDVVRIGEGTRVPNTYTPIIYSEVHLSVTQEVNSFVDPIHSSSSSGLVSVVSGQVTLNGNPVEGAIIYGINDSQQDIEVRTTTDANGEYRIEFPPNEVAHIAVQYEDTEGNQYNDESKPFIG